MYSECIYLWRKKAHSITNKSSFVRQQWALMTPCVVTMENAHPSKRHLFWQVSEICPAAFELQCLDQVYCSGSTGKTVIVVILSSGRSCEAPWAAASHSLQVPGGKGECCPTLCLGESWGKFCALDLFWWNTATKKAQKKKAVAWHSFCVATLPLKAEKKGQDGWYDG